MYLTTRAALFPVFAFIIAATVGCGSTAVDQARQAMGPISRLERDVQPQVVNVKNQDAVNQTKVLAEIYAKSYATFDDEVKNAAEGNPANFYSEIILQQQKLLDSAEKLQASASEMNRGVNEQAIENIRYTVLELGKQIKNRQEITDKVLNDQMEEVSKIRRQLDNILRRSRGVDPSP